MKTYQELSMRYMRSNRKRSLLTLVGIILSVALICSTGLFFKGMQKAQIRYYKETIGSYHLIYTAIAEEDAFRILQNPKVAKAGYVYQGEQKRVGEDLSILPIVAENEEVLSMLPYPVKEGKLPNAAGEIALEEWMLPSVQANEGIGSRIRIGGEDYLLTGILRNNVYTQMRGEGAALLAKSEEMPAQKFFMVQIRENVSMKKALSELERFGTEESIEKNVRLLAVQGVSTGPKMTQTMVMTIGTLIGIIVVSTIALIYNAFQISLVERIRQFGLLQAVGADKRQIRKLVLREAGLLGMTGSIIGSACGVVALYIVIRIAKILLPQEIFHRSVAFDISWTVIGGSILIGVVTVLISALLPARYASRVTPLSAISGRMMIRKEEVARVKSSLIGRWIGFEGDLAIKNMKRNKKRYRSTVLSVMIGVVLFVTTSYFVDLLTGLNEQDDMSRKVHFSVSPSYRRGSKVDQGIPAQIEDKILDVRELKKVYNVYEAQAFSTEMEKSKGTLEEERSEGRYFDSPQEGMMQLMVDLTPVNDQVLELIQGEVVEGRVRAEELRSAGGVILVRQHLFFDEGVGIRRGAIADLKVGDEIALCRMEGTNDSQKGESSVVPVFEEEQSRRVKILAVIEEAPLQVAQSESRVKLLTVEEVAERLSGESPKLMSMHMTVEDLAKEKEVADQLLQITQKTSSIGLVNWVDEYRISQSGMILIQILLYGFSLVVSLIGCANIVNTMTTGIILRRREIGMLRAVGLSGRGLRKTILIEGVFYGVQGVLFGSVLACGLSYVIFNGISGIIDKGGFVLPYRSIGIAFALAMIIGALSVLSPLRRIQQESLTDAIRQEG